MHPLLQRQLVKAFGSETPPEVLPLLPLLDAAYVASDEDRTRYQRSLGVMSEELQARFDALSDQFKERERHFRILQAVHDGVLLLDDAARVLEVNESALRVTGQPRPQLAGRALGELVQGTNPGAPPDLAALAASPGTSSEDVLVARPDGSIRRCEMTVAPLDDVAATSGRWIVVLRDVTDRRTLQNQLFQSHKLEAIGQLAAGVAHEINTPAQYVADNLRFLGESFETMCGELFKEGVPAPENLEFLRTEVPDAIQQSLSGMDRIAEIVRGIKTFSHPGTGTRAATDLNHVLQTTVAVARNEWKYVADLDLDLDPHLPQVWVYVDEVQHVFLNLVVNAAQAIASNTGEGRPRGRIRVSSRAQQGWVEIRVEDNGPGVPDAIRERVFDPFFTTKPAGQGTGQGLAICHRVVEHHDGRIALEKGEDGGAVFVVRLPFATPVAEAA